jgi:hypothetical protein
VSEPARPARISWGSCNRRRRRPETEALPDLSGTQRFVQTGIPLSERRTHAGGDGQRTGIVRFPRDDPASVACRVATRRSARAKQHSGTSANALSSSLQPRVRAVSMSRVRYFAARQQRYISIFRLLAWLIANGKAPPVLDGHAMSVPPCIGRSRRVTAQSPRASRRFCLRSVPARALSVRRSSAAAPAWRRSSHPRHG